VTLGIIEINDSGIQVAVDGRTVRVSPGYAVLDGDRLLVGEQGLSYCRLLPSWTNNRFWNQLSTEPIANATSGIRHHADLAFAHLESLWTPISDEVDEVVFLVPGFYDRQQLSLLLGMAKEAGIPTSGIVDTSLVGAAELALREVVLHLDIHLHRITLTRLANTANLARVDATTLTETGLFTLWDRWANIIANQFIQSSRYDPLHQAVSEQALYSALPEWIAALGDRRSLGFDLNLEDQSYSVALSHEQLLSAVTPIYPQIIQAIRNQLGGAPATLLVSHRFSGFPGLRDSLKLISNVEMIHLPQDQVIRGTMSHTDKIIGNGSIAHVVNLAVNTQKVVDDIERPRRATHLLSKSHAVAVGHSYKLSGDLSSGIHQDLDHPVCTIYPRGEHLYMDIHVSGDIRVNGASANDEMALTPGDEITVGDHTVTVISVN
jgi:hypothetical protein